MDPLFYFQLTMVFMAGMLVGYFLTKRSSNSIETPNQFYNEKTLSSASSLTRNKKNNEPTKEIIDQTKQLVHQKHLMKAIGLIWMNTNWDLQRSKDYVESLITQIKETDSSIS